jgi:hypothetical protein
MKTIRHFVFAPALLLLSACLPSVHPFYLPSDVVVDPALIGQWRAAEDDDWELWTFATRDEGGYEIKITTNEDKTGTFIGQLFSLGGRRYLDLIAGSCDFAKSQHEIVSVSIFPGHLLARIDQVDGGIKLAFFDWEWLEKHLKNNPGALAHRLEDDSILLTADTKALQAFVLAHSGDGELYEADDATLYTRVPPAAAPESPPAP